MAAEGGGGLDDDLQVRGHWDSCIPTYQRYSRCSPSVLRNVSVLGMLRVVDRRRVGKSKSHLMIKLGFLSVPTYTVQSIVLWDSPYDSVKMFYSYIPAIWVAVYGPRGP